MANHIGNLGLSTHSLDLDGGISSPLSVSQITPCTGNIGLGFPPGAEKLTLRGSLSVSQNSALVGMAADQTHQTGYHDGDRGLKVSRSDVRIKQVQGRSDPQADLTTLCQLEITDYTLKDSLDHDPHPHKKVLGQQIAEVYPQAVSRITEVVPDIFQPATLRAGWVQLPNHDLKLGERVQLLINGEEPTIYVVQAVGPDQFQVATDYDGPLFIYGREVDDFHQVDYAALAMLNISATQALCDTVEKLKRDVTQLKNRLSHLTAVSDRMARRGRRDP